ncbi:hypothetical protein FRB93_000880 [Tulasnella sp. JGI-2019a]|nr:hypothetical protein FRB93_000880 [Tulasnella sp. JGI-2019a]
MDFSDSLDLCLSCGNHVADGTPYCSIRCSSLDRSARRSSVPSSRQQSSSSSHRSFAAQSSHHIPQRRALLELQDPSSSSHFNVAHSDEDEFLDIEPEHLPSHLNKLASIAEWAEGVWGGAASSDDEDSMVSRQQPIRTRQSTSQSSTSSRSKLMAACRPQFTLSVAQVAPPAMSITTSLDDDNSSVMTPSSVAARSTSSSPKLMIQHKRKPSSGSGVNVNPWITSPPYEFAYTHQHSQQKQQQQPMVVPSSIRGRTMIRA